MVVIRVKMDICSLSSALQVLAMMANCLDRVPSDREVQFIASLQQQPDSSIVCEQNNHDDDDDDDGGATASAHDTFLPMLILMPLKLIHAS